MEQGRTYGSVVEDLVLWLQRNAAALSDGVLPPRSRFVYRHCVAAVFSALFAHIMREPSRNASRDSSGSFEQQRHTAARPPAPLLNGPRDQTLGTCYSVSRQVLRRSLRCSKGSFRSCRWRPNRTRCRASGPRRSSSSRWGGSRPPQTSWCVGTCGRHWWRRWWRWRRQPVQRSSSSKRICVRTWPGFPLLVDWVLEGAAGGTDVHRRRCHFPYRRACIASGPTGSSAARRRPPQPRPWRPQSPSCAPPPSSAEQSASPSPHSKLTVRSGSSAAARLSRRSRCGRASAAPPPVRAGGACACREGKAAAGAWGTPRGACSVPPLRAPQQDDFNSPRCALSLRSSLSVSVQERGSVACSSSWPVTGPPCPL